MDNTKKVVLIAREDISNKVVELGKAINQDFLTHEGEELVVISLLKGAMPFTVDLIRTLDMPVRLEIMVASSYGDGTKSSGKVNVAYQSFSELDNRHVLLVDDIIDSGNTLKAVGELVQTYKPASLRYCAFLNKPSRREVDLAVDYVGFDIPDEFVIGYGLDFAGKYRELPDICAIREGE